ncbi:MAG: thymidine phosphorylase [Alkalispirochaetaceae bacterium]
MRALDLIIKKREGGELSKEELEFLIEGYVAGEIPEYQVSSFLMAVYFQGMSRREAGYLTQAMIDSGETIDLSSVSGPLVDKHSTGGVGDKVSLILAPLVAAGGVKVPMMSGRALGHTGGTLDKLDSIPGYRSVITAEEFASTIRRCGYGMTGQSKEIVPADRLLYALRDVTGTVESVPLITSSILSKKFAEGADALVFDVKCGAGAFMKSIDEARELASSLVETGKSLGKNTVAVITRMDAPLGSMVGNFVEVEEACASLGGSSAKGTLTSDSRSDDLMEVTLRLAAWMLLAGGKAASVEEGEKICRENLENGRAWETFLKNVELQGGDTAELKRQLGSRRAPLHYEVPAGVSGVLTGIDAYKTGMAGVYLGAGRSTAEDKVRYDVGIELLKKPGEPVEAGDSVARIYADEEEHLAQALKIFQDGITIEGVAGAREKPSMILEEISTL